MRDAESGHAEFQATLDAPVISPGKRSSGLMPSITTPA